MNDITNNFSEGNLNNANYNSSVLNEFQSEHDYLTQDCDSYKNKAIEAIAEVFPGFNSAFEDPFSNVPLAILSNYPTSSDFLAAPKSDVINTMISKSNESSEWCDNKYNELFNLATNASNYAGVNNSTSKDELKFLINIVHLFSDSVVNLEQAMYDLGGNTIK